MTEPTLVVMAAGMGNRYGGLKQIDPVGPGGEIMLDYSVYDALRAGFDKVVFIIRREMENIFRDKVGRLIEEKTQVDYVFQELDDLPPGFSVPPDRTKPWGTGHAAMICRGVVDTPFAVINADDFYGPSAFASLGEYLRNAKDGDFYDYCMVGYKLANTLSENGEVARGVCDVSDQGLLISVTERTRIARIADDIAFAENGDRWTTLPDDTIVSLNAWGFTPGFLDELRSGFAAFLTRSIDNISKAEYFLPAVVGELLHKGKARVSVLPTGEKWFGVTYKEDRPMVQAALRGLIEKGVYPERLWG